MKEDTEILIGLLVVLAVFLALKFNWKLLGKGSQDPTNQTTGQPLQPSRQNDPLKQNATVLFNSSDLGFGDDFL